MRRREHIGTPELPAQNDTTFSIDPVNLENRLRDVQPDRHHLTHGLLQLSESLSSLGTGEAATASIVDLP